MPTPIIHVSHLSKIYQTEAMETVALSDITFDIKKGERYQDFKARMEDPEKNTKWEARAKEPLSEAELKELRETIRKAREDVKTLASQVLETVWQDK